MILLLSDASKWTLKWTAVAIGLAVIVVLIIAIVVAIMNVRQEKIDQQTNPHLEELATTGTWVNVWSDRRKQRVASKIWSESQKNLAMSARNENKGTERITRVAARSRVQLTVRFTALLVQVLILSVLMSVVRVFVRLHPYVLTVPLQSGDVLHVYHVHLTEWIDHICFWGVIVAFIAALFSAMFSLINWAGDYKVLTNYRMMRIFVFPPWAFWKDNTSYALELSLINSVGSDQGFWIRGTKAGTLKTGTAGDEDDKWFNDIPYVPDVKAFEADLNQARMDVPAGVAAMADDIKNAIRAGFTDAVQELKQQGVQES